MNISLKGTRVKVSEIARVVSAELSGNGNASITGLCSLDDSLPDHISLYTGHSSRNLKQILETSRVSALLIRSDLSLPDLSPELALLKVKDPVRALIDLVPIFVELKPSVSGISSKAEIHPSATLELGVSVGAFTSIGAEVHIGKNSTIYQNVVIYPGVTIGSNVTIHAGAVIRENCIIEDGCVVQNGAVVGSDGFGFAQVEHRLIAVPQVGNVKLSSNVELGANSCIDRATLGVTSVGTGTKIDNLVQIGHNCKIGASSILCGQSGVAGSCTIGNGVVIGGQAGIADHLTIADGARLSAKAGLTGDITEKGDYAGYPAVPLSAWRRQMKVLQNLARRKKPAAER